MSSTSLLALALLLPLAALLVGPGRAAGAKEPREQPRPILRVYVPRDEFSALLSPWAQPMRSMPGGR